MGFFKEEKTAEEMELEKLELEMALKDFQIKYNLPSLSLEEFLILKNKFEETKMASQMKQIIPHMDATVNGEIANMATTFQNFFILEQLGRNQQQLEDLNQKFDILIELLSKNKK